MTRSDSRNQTIGKKRKNRLISPLPLCSSIRYPSRCFYWDGWFLIRDTGIGIRGFEFELIFFNLDICFAENI
jgi:hypothetical protein